MFQISRTEPAALGTPELLMRGAGQMIQYVATRSHVVKSLSIIDEGSREQTLNFFGVVQSMTRFHGRPLCRVSPARSETVRIYFLGEPYD